ncbi:MAG: hypothetical protein D6802_10470 [Ardenticatenia bacterium]|nr:MAG: hypothetical protein D6802_10470 [Ardenticatenia bacterium]
MHVHPDTTARATVFATLARAWLAEIRPEDLPTLAALPSLMEALGEPTSDRLTDLAVEYQRLFGFDVPPYESVFLDPSGLLMAPATARVEAAYARLGWQPLRARVGAADHVGLELALVADLLGAGRVEAAAQVVHEHLAFWVPLLVLTIRRLEPDPFYATLAEETLGALFELLDAYTPPQTVALPLLPPQPRYEANGLPEPDVDEAAGPGLRELVRQLLTPRRAGLFITRDDIRRLARQLELPVGMGTRQTMLVTLFRLAGQYDEVEALLAGLHALLDESAQSYVELSSRMPAWRPYADCWLQRVEETAQILRSV